MEVIVNFLHFLGPDNIFYYVFIERELSPTILKLYCNILDLYVPFAMWPPPPLLVTVVIECHLIAWCTMMIHVP